MTAVTGAGRPVTPASKNRTGPEAGFAAKSGAGFGLGPGREPAVPVSSPSDDHPELRFAALTGLAGLAVPFLLAFALRADLARIEVPAAVQYVADGGYVVIDLLFVLAGFLLCRPLTAVLSRSGTEARTSSGAAGLARALARQIVPLHLFAWTLTVFLMLTAEPARTFWSWLSSGLLLNGVIGPEPAGYPVGWSVSVALFGTALLVLAALAVTSRPGRLRRAHPDALVIGLAVVSILLGAAFLLLTGPEATGTAGVPAIGQALLGLGLGVAAFRVLEGGTGTLKPPMPRTAPAPTPAPGLGAALALAALLFCIYRSDLVHQVDLLPVFVASAALVYFLAVPHQARLSWAHRLLTARPLQWLGERAVIFYLLHGPVQLAVERIGDRADAESTTVTWLMIAATTFGSLAAAELGHRLLKHTPAPAAATASAGIDRPGATAIDRIPRSRQERIAQIDQTAIPSELRLKPLPAKAAPARPTTRKRADPDTRPVSIAGIKAAASARPAAGEAAAVKAPAKSTPAPAPAPAPVKATPASKRAAKAATPAAPATPPTPFKAAAPRTPAKAAPAKPAVPAQSRSSKPTPEARPEVKAAPGAPAGPEAVDLAAGDPVDLDQPEHTPSVDQS